MNKPSGKTVLFIAAGAAAALIITVIIICISLFIKADEQARNAYLLQHAVIESTSIAETIKSSDNDLQTAGQLLREHKQLNISDDTLILYYDEDLRPSPHTDSPYRATVVKTPLEGYISYEIVIADSDGDNEIYSLSFKTLIQGGGQ